MHLAAQSGAKSDNLHLLKKSQHISALFVKGISFSLDFFRWAWSHQLFQNIFSFRFKVMLSDIIIIFIIFIFNIMFWRITPSQTLKNILWEKCIIFQGEQGRRILLAKFPDKLCKAFPLIVHISNSIPTAAAPTFSNENIKLKVG